MHKEPIHRDQQELTKSEQLKIDSNGLYGAIAQELGDPSPSFSDGTSKLLKHHGAYQQDDRDTRTERKKQGLDRDYTMMVRTKFPAGHLTAEQYLVCDDLATKYGQNDMRVTSRQDFQFHGVIKHNFRALLHDLNHLAEITTMGACGDVVRNTIAAPVSDIDPRFVSASIDLYGLAKKISDRFMPATPSYYDLWIDDEKARINEDGTVTYLADLGADPFDDPLYGKQYLPRKFKIGLGTDFDNSIDLYTNDIGIMAVTAEGALLGYEILVGGGLGYTHKKPKTYARLATPLAFVPEEDILPLVEAIVKVQRDYGDREDRRHARLKYLVDDCGIEKLRELISDYAGRQFPAPKNAEPTAQPDYLGWHKQAQNSLNYVGVWIENGRIRDFPGAIQFKSGLRAIVERFRPSVRLTAHHNAILANIRDEDVQAVQAMLDEYGIPTNQGISQLRRLEMACPALPLCGLAMSEAERAMPGVIHSLEEAGHGDADVIIRMSGCPNNCSRPRSAEIGIVGNGPDRYHLHVGGDYMGRRLCEPLMENIGTDQLATVISHLLGAWKEERQHDERFGDWAHRLGMEALLNRIETDA